MRLKKKKKIIESLIGFYVVVSTFYKGCVQYEDEAVRGLMIYMHINELFNYHKEIAKQLKLPEPNELVGKNYEKYIQDWNKYITAKAPIFNEAIKIYVDKKCDYII